ncbi:MULTISPECIES: hypothetical protein [Megamonas]|uniref:hypothetical protein n=1 Tax=Megamonas TaxID=158846 RepID=UPI001959C747|nr:hypothetical protein [Megamonas rupellensis]MBM6747779.1 hypothetical protein [Megamonas rupellensis]
MTDVIIFHTDEQGNKTACIMSNSNTAFDDLFEFIKDDNFKIINTRLNEKAFQAFIEQNYKH